ncbi:MAG: hypothetical protein KGL13_07440 [Gammaproteobacteria bacterium]|nr:hypothetical protein [Gammaproteobacteria bacterium]MDE2346286.1 hypothetical protein [Gammaproteobacteria bacterium]
MNKTLTVLGASLLLLGCATQKPAANNQAGPVIMHGTKPEADKNMICSRSRPMDSHIPELICVTPAEAAARKKAAQQQMQNYQNSPSAGGCPPTCDLE